MANNTLAPIPQTIVSLAIAAAILLVAYSIFHSYVIKGAEATDHQHRAITTTGVGDNHTTGASCSKLPTGGRRCCQAGFNSKLEWKNYDWRHVCYPAGWQGNGYHRKGGGGHGH